MKICVSGWYFCDSDKRISEDEYNTFYYTLAIAHKKYPVFIASHFKSEFLDNLGLPYAVTPIYGLEFASYDYYLKNEWDYQADVLFMHDDEKVAGLEVFDQIAALKDEGIDQAYIFEDEAEARANGRQHGRGIYCSQKFLLFCLAYVCKCREAEDHYDEHNPNVLLPGCGPHTGIWFDRYNNGFVSGKVPRGMRHYNSEIYHFTGIAIQAGRRGLKTRHQAYIPGFVSGRRGKFGTYDGFRERLRREKEAKEAEEKK